MNQNSSTPLDIMAIEAEHRLTRPLAISIDLGGKFGQLNDNYLRVSSIQGQESVSQLYQFTVDVKVNEIVDFSQEPAGGASNFQQQQAPTLAQGLGSQLLGKWAQLRLGLPYHEDRFNEKNEQLPPDWENDTPSRFFSGIVSSVSHVAPGCYQLVIQSPLYPLTLRNRYTVHEKSTIKELLRSLLANERLKYNPHLALKFNLEGDAVKRKQDWLQAGESDFEFLQRMLTKANIHFYAIHHSAGNASPAGQEKQASLTLVFSNKTTSVQEVDIPGCGHKPLKLRYSYTNIKALKLQQSDLFCDLKYEVKMVQQTVKTVLTRQQAAWETNEIAKYTSYTVKAHQINNDNVTDSDSLVDYYQHRNYAYGVDEHEVAAHERKLQQQLATEEGTLSGTSTSPLLSPGYTFVLSQALIGDSVESTMPTQFDGRVFVVTKVSHKVSDEEAYIGSIEATEVNTSENESEHTLITPFNMQSTNQGSILAKVVKTAVPKNWRYSEKNNFDISKSSISYDNKTKSQIGCLVQFATDSGADDSKTHWIALSATSQTAPEVNSVVVIGRGSNESEIPEIQQVLSSHGQKNINPPERRSNHWSANTSWGCNYSTSYGDGISIRYGNNSKIDLPKAINIVENAYDHSIAGKGNIGNSSFSKGSSFSFSTTDDGANGLANASVSQGCNFSESHSEQNYGVSFTKNSQNFSKTTKSVGISYMGAFSDTVDSKNPSFIKDKIPNQEIIDICDGLPNGTSFNQSHITGKTINLSGTGTKPPSVNSYDKSATVYSHSKTQGKVVNKNEHLGDSYSSSETNGNNHNKSHHIGNSDNSSFTLGNSNNSSTTIGNANSVNNQLGEVENTNLFLGIRNDKQTNISEVKSMSMTLGNTNAIDTSISEKNTISTNIAKTNSISTHIGPSNSLSTNISESNSLSTNLSKNNAITTNIGVNNNVTTNISANNSISTNLGLTNAVETYIGAKNTISTSIAANSNISNSIGGTVSLTNNISDSLSVSNNIGSTVSLANNISNSLSVSNSIGNTVSLANNISNEFSINNSLANIVKINNSAGSNTEINNGVLKVEGETATKARMETTTAKIITINIIL